MVASNKMARSPLTQTGDGSTTREATPTATLATIGTSNTAQTTKNVQRTVPLMELMRRLGTKPTASALREML
jgi:hypothetical protein